MLQIEGVATCGVAIISYFLLPDYPTNTRWLSEDEKNLIIRRLQEQNLSAAEEEDIGHWESLKSAYRDWRTYVFILMYTLATGSMTITYL